jgi:hypothetical protein
MSNISAIAAVAASQLLLLLLLLLIRDPVRVSQQAAVCGVKGRPVVLRERQVLCKAPHQVRIADEVSANGNCRQRRGKDTTLFWRVNAPNDQMDHVSCCKFSFELQGPQSKAGMPLKDHNALNKLTPVNK